MSSLLDDQDLDRKPSTEAAALAATAGDLAALQIPGASTEPTQLPALAAQMTDVQPVASTSRVTLDLYGQPVPNPAAAAAVDRSDMEDSATEDEELPQGTVGINARDDDEETEEDEDSSDEETLRAVQKRQGQARRMEAVQGLYPGEQVLPDEEFGTKTVAEIYAMLEANVINLSPDYQRDVVWPENQAAGLIESLLRNMHVPEILFNTYTPVPEDLWYTAIKAKSIIEPEGSAPLHAGFDETWSADEVETNPKLAAARARGDLVPRDVWNCADGKQRMSSIKRFMRGEFQITGEDGTRYTYASLPPQARKVLDSKRLRYGLYRDLSDAQEREIFRRVQLGKALDKGEIMNAITSPYADWVQKIKDDLFSQRPDRLARSLRPRLLTGKRGLALNAAYAISNNLLRPISEIKFEGDAIRSRKMASNEPPPRHKQLDVDVALKRFVELTQVPPLEGEDRWPSTDKYRKLREHNVPVPHRVWRLRPEDVKGHEHKKVDAVALAPVELNTLPAVVHHFRDLSNGDLLEVVFRLRKHLHETFPGEMKDNSKLYNAVKDWVAEFDPSSLKHRYKDDGTLRKKGESSTPVNARPPKRRLPREGPEHTPVSANKRAALDLTMSDDAAPPPSRDRDRRDERAERSSSQARQSDTQRSSTNGTQKPKTTSSASRPLPRPISTSSTSNGSKAPAPPRQPPPRPPPPPQPGPAAQATTSNNSTGGLSWKQAKFARNFTPGPPTNGGASTSQPQRSAIHSLPSSKRMTGPLEFDERGRPILNHHETGVQPDMAENDAQAAFYDQADDDMQRIMAQKRQYASGANGAGWGGSMNGRSPFGGGGNPDPDIGMPPTPTSADPRDQQLQEIIASKQQAHSHSAAPHSRPTSAFNNNPGGGGGGFRQYGSDLSGPRFPPADSGWSRAPTSGANGYQPEHGFRTSGGHSPYERPAERTPYSGPPAPTADPRVRR